MSAATLALINAYRDAVAQRVFWEDHGSHGDGRLEDARKVESSARRALVKAMSA